MQFIIFFLTAGALAIIIMPFLKKEKLAMWAGGGIIISSIIVAAKSTYYTCQDGWASHSIGRQGACSWHGGVVSRLTNFGWVILISSSVVIGIAIIYVLYKKKSKERRNKINTSYGKYDVRREVRK